MKVKSIINSLGKEVTFDLTENNSLTQLDLSRLSRGVYFVKIETQNKYNTIKIVKE